MDTLEIINLCAYVEDKLILNNFNLTIKSGETHAIMGPNGTGKSTLSKVIMADQTYKVKSGDIKFNGKSINDLKTDERANLGIFLGMQMPLEIEGVTNADFLRSSLMIKEKEDFKLMNFIKNLDTNIEKLKMNKEMIHREVNNGFSGGERKKNEILQMRMLTPKVILLDEIDSGLDIDSLKIIGKNVVEYKKENNPAVLLITHYQRLFKYIKPDFIHIMIDGKIVKTGDISLVKEIEENGYENFKKGTSSGTNKVKDILNHE